MKKAAWAVLIALGVGLSAVEFWAISTSGHPTNILGGLGLLMILTGMAGWVAQKRDSPPGRFLSALIDLVVWTAVLCLVIVTANLTFVTPFRANPGQFNYVIGLATLSANLYLAISNWLGRSVGKALLGLKLVVVADPLCKPGLARGLVRSSLQAGPGMGALMILTGAHDHFAGTRIVAGRKEGRDPAAVQSESFSLSMDAPRLGVWKVVLAVVLHLFFAFMYMFLAAN